MAFQYQPFVNPYAASIGETLAHQNDAQAHAAEVIGAAQAHAQEVSGQAYGGAVAGIGQAVGGAIDQATDPKRQLEQQQVAANKRTQAFSDTVNKIQSSLLSQNPDGSKPVDLVKAKQMLTAANVPLPMQDTLLKSIEGINSSVSTFNSQRVDHLADLAHGALQSIAHGVDPTTALAFGTAVAKANGTITDDQLAPLATAIGQGADPKTLLEQARSQSEKYKDLSKPVVLADKAKLVDPLAPPGTPPLADNSDPLDGAYTINGQRFRKDGTAIGALVPPQAPKATPTLEEQYLTAVAGGDKDTASNIAKTWADKAAASRDPNATAQLAAIRNISAEAAQARLDDMNPQSPKSQQKFEQEYRTVLQRGLSSRSGGLGLEDAKVQQANHLKSLLDQNFDPKTGDWNIPRVQLNELALGLARLTAPGGQAGEGMLKEFQQRTAKGDLAGFLTYVTGDPVPANTQAITKYLADSIDRQGKTAEQNRQGEMAYLRGLVPTDLSEDRRQKLEATSLNPLRQSRVIQNSSTGERKLQVSTDGGATWK